MADLKLNEYGDIDAFASGGAWISDLEAVVQRLKIRFQTHLGEWFLDYNLGLDWLGLLDQKPNRTMQRWFEAQITRNILRTTGVERITEKVKANFDGKLKTLTFAFKCKAADIEEELDLVAVAPYYNAGAITITVLNFPSGEVTL